MFRCSKPNALRMKSVNVSTIRLPVLGLNGELVGCIVIHVKIRFAKITTVRYRAGEIYYWESGIVHVASPCVNKLVGYIEGIVRPDTIPVEIY